MSNIVAECIDQLLSYFGCIGEPCQWGFESRRDNWNFFHSEFYLKILKYGLVRPKIEKNFSIRISGSEVMNE